MSRSARRILLCLWLCPWIYSGQASGDGSVPGWNKLVYLIYRIEVTNYCGTTTNPVIAGFHLQRKSILAEYPLPKPLIESARTEADKLAYHEWNNRGLGGFKRWCRNDDTRYANQFIQTLTTQQK